MLDPYILQDIANSLRRIADNTSDCGALTRAIRESSSVYRPPQMQLADPALTALLAALNAQLNNFTDEAEVIKVIKKHKPAGKKAKE